MQNEQTIPCPVCRTGIPFDARQMLQGMRFACARCGSEIGLPSESKDVVEKALTAFDEGRRKLGKSN